MPYGYPGTTNYGSAPYEESTKRKLLRALAGGLIGLGGATPGASFGQALGQGFGRSYLAARTERDAAMEYAMKMEDQRRRQEADAQRQANYEARTEAMKKPEGPSLDERLKEFEEKERIKAKYRPKPAGAGSSASKVPKPTAIPRRIPSGAKAPTEQQIIESIMEETDPAVLAPYISGRGGADSRAIREAAQMRSNEIMRQRH